MASAAVQQLLEEGQRSGLFSVAVAQDLIAQMTPNEALTTNQVAAQMIEKKVLTPYQAEQLLAGRGDECMVAGRYRILEKLGEGGMGAVYLAHDTQLDRDVAVKVLPAQSLNDADAIARFQREARALAKLSHPHIIQAYDNGEDKGRHFLVMEYVEGANLSAILREQGAIAPTLAADMIYQAALGLRHAHEKGLVHRDLKPANLLLSPAQALAGRRAPAALDLARPASQLTTSYVAPAALSKGIVKILDLGLARFLQDQLGDSQLTKEGIGVGTPDYMAPEQFRDALHADARTDIYGLGCTLYQLISGTVPFPGSSFSEKAAAHAKKEPIPLEERCPEVPAGLAFVVSKMMAKHPADRFQTAAEVAEALAPYVAGASHSMILLRQTMRFHAGQLTMRAPNRRKRLLAWVGGILAAACFVGLFILAWPSIFPRGSGGPQNDSRTQTAGPGKAAPEPGKPKVITIENGLTVAKDGTGQYTTIGEALAKVKPGMTIQVLDDATYPEAITINDAKRHSEIVLEAIRGARLVLLAEFPAALAIEKVPRVTVRGFRFQFSGGSENSVFVNVTGQCSGVRLENLEIKAAAMVNGIRLNRAWSDENDQPIVIRNCVLQVGYDGIIVLGHAAPDGTKRARGIAIRDNKVLTALRGVRIVRGVEDVHVTGNILSNCGQVALQIEDPPATLSGLLVANNTAVNSVSGLRIWDESPFEKLLPGQVTMANNLFFDNHTGDALFYLDEAERQNPGDGSALIKTWSFAHNWRDLEGNKTRFIIPLAKNDKKLEEKDRPPMVVSERNFLRPAKDSPLATGGAGGDLPTYVGAVPPEGVEPWDWQKTWDAVVHNRLTVSKDPKTGGQFRTIGDALAKVKPGMTIRVLDNATYAEELVLSERTKHAHVTLEASKGAVIELAPSSSSAIAIRKVPGVRVRGFRFSDRDMREGSFDQFILVTGHTPGVVLEDLTMRANTEGLRGISLQYVTTVPAEAPVTIRRCQIQGGADGVWVGGPSGPDLNDAPASGIVISENRIWGTKRRGIQLTGKLSRCQITANQVWNIGMFGIQFEDLESGSDQLLVANNTVFRCSMCFDLWDNEPRKKYAAGQAELRNNLLFDAGDSDLAFVLAKVSPAGNVPVGGGDGKSLVKLWKFGHNHRDLSGRQRIFAVPLAPGDRIVKPADLPPLDAASPEFLRPAPDSPLATGGAGGDVPTYVGAVPPEGVEPWDWQKTWDSRARKFGQQEVKTGTNRLTLPLQLLE